MSASLETAVFYRQVLTASSCHGLHQLLTEGNVNNWIHLLGFEKQLIRPVGFLTLFIRFADFRECLNLLRILLKKLP
jgi:hypothetical protein